MDSARRRNRRSSVLGAGFLGMLVLLPSSIAACSTCARSLGTRLDQARCRSTSATMKQIAGAGGGDCLPSTVAQLDRMADQGRRASQRWKRAEAVRSNLIDLRILHPARLPRAGSSPLGWSPPRWVSCLFVDQWLNMAARTSSGNRAAGAGRRWWLVVERGCHVGHPCVHARRGRWRRALMSASGRSGADLAPFLAVVGRSVPSTGPGSRPAGLSVGRMSARVTTGPSGADARLRRRRRNGRPAIVEELLATDSLPYTVGGTLSSPRRSRGVPSPIFTSLPTSSPDSLLSPWASSPGPRADVGRCESAISGTRSTRHLAEL